MKTIRLSGQDICLLPERAAFWPSESALLLADVHIGKDQVFRHAGVAVPAGVAAAELARIDALLARTGAERLVILGDWIHAPPRPGDDWPEQVLAWRQSHQALTIDLVLGNHDRKLAGWLNRWDMQPHQPGLALAGLQLVHEWQDALGQPAISGHLHPGAILQDRRQRLRLPAFLLGHEQLVLPAFGRFTGLMTETDFPARQRIAIADQALYELPA